MTQLPAVALAVVFCGALVLLILGGDGLMRGAAGLASRRRIDPVVIGLTIVALATSMPELVASLISVLADKADLAVGNIVGSNLANLGMILGVAAVWRTIPTQSRLIRFDLPFMVGATLVFWMMGWVDFRIGRWDGIALLAVLGSYLWFVLATRHETAVTLEMVQEIGKPVAGVRTCWLLMLGGTIGLVAGADLLVASSVEMAARMGVSEALVGLTLVAVGTSLPELVATVIGAIRRQTGLVVGNLVGSNLFNLTLIGGLTGALVPFPISAELFALEFPLMVLLTLVAAWFLFTEQRLSRAEGIWLLAFYGFFIFMTVLVQTG